MPYSVNHNNDEPMKFSVSAQTSEPSKKTVLKLLVDTGRFQPSKKTVLKLLVDTRRFQPSKKTVLKLLVDTGRFHMAAAETAKSLALTTILVCRTSSFMVLADHRCRRPAALDKTRPRTSFSVFVAELTLSNF